MVNLRLPNINGSNERDRLAQMQSYLYQLVEQLQFALNTVGISQDNTVSSKSKFYPLIVGGNMISDTGWISLGISEEANEAALNTGRSGNGCFYRVINGKHVYVAFNASFSYAGSTVTISGSSIPDSYKPSRNIYALNTANGRVIAQSLVNSSGDVCVEYVQDMASTETTANVTVDWIDGYIDYFV